MSFGIVGRPGDRQVAAVRRCLRERGDSDPFVLDLSLFPARTALTLRDDMPATPGRAGVEHVRTWYVRTMPLPLPFYPGDADTAHARRAAYAAGRERRSLAFSFLTALQHHGAHLVNTPAAFGQHFLKLDQLRVLRAVGVPVPRSLATSDPQAVTAFAAEIGGPLVYKPLAGGALCRRLTPQDLHPDRLRLLSAAPVLFQEEVPGTNIRVYVVAETVVAAYEIVSDSLDYRGAEQAVLPAVLGAHEHRACLAAARACAMDFTGIDIRRRPNGTFALLECNPSPMFAAVERRTGDNPVSRALADLLTGRQPAPAALAERPAAEPRGHLAYPRGAGDGSTTAPA
ncbi:RimK family alpha-L-glutamate ligase [Kitasatospora sp. NPDC059812]|uniref:ATP-grasp domain-containing protein n=1 Tax=Kitasatospora sp. NPDC059812 TaxID=3346958 RepID=UPI00366917B6